MNKSRSIEILKRQREISATVTSLSTSDPGFKKWQRDTEVAVERIFGRDSRHLAEFKDIRYSPGVFITGMSNDSYGRALANGVKSAGAMLDSMIDEIGEYGLADDALEDSPDVLNLLEKICLKFHAAARQLQHRHADRPTISIDDEYDVQDLLHAILRLHFDDVRPEEWTGSYAGRASRVDFLLKAERVVVEVKKTRPSMKSGDLGEQLIIDRARYQTHPDCDTLVCFVYDPEGRIGNPAGIERDLEGVQAGLRTRVIIAPRN